MTEPEGLRPDEQETNARLERINGMDADELGRYLAFVEEEAKISPQWAQVQGVVERRIELLGNAAAPSPVPETLADAEPAEPEGEPEAAPAEPAPGAAEPEPAAAPAPDPAPGPSEREPEAELEPETPAGRSAAVEPPPSREARSPLLDDDEFETDAEDRPERATSPVLIALRRRWRVVAAGAAAAIVVVGLGAWTLVGASAPPSDSASASASPDASATADTATASTEPTAAATSGSEPPVDTAAPSGTESPVGTASPVPTSEPTLGPVSASIQFAADAAVSFGGRNSQLCFVATTRPYVAGASFVASVNPSDGVVGATTIEGTTDGRGRVRLSWDLVAGASGNWIVAVDIVAPDGGSAHADSMAATQSAGSTTWDELPPCGF